MGTNQRLDIIRTGLMIHLLLVITDLIKETYSLTIFTHLQSSIFLVDHSRQPYPSNYHYLVLHLLPIDCSTRRHSHCRHHNLISVSLKIKVDFVFCINLSFDILLVN